MRNLSKTICRILTLCVLIFSFALPAWAQEIPSFKKNDLKVTLLSLGSGSSRFTYERAFSQKNSAEFTLGLISWGWDMMNKTNSNGLLLKFAYKWNVSPTPNVDSWLSGFYLKPELVFANFDYSAKKDMSSQRNHTAQGALMAEFGYQVILQQWFVFDIYSGLGASMGTGNENNYFHSFMLFPRESMLAFTAGFRVGVAF